MQWNSRWTLLITIALPVLIYLWGLWNLWRRSGAGRGITPGHLIRFLTAILALILALTWPLDELSDELFSAHMVQHLILILVIAPLLVTSEFPLALLWALPRRGARQLAPRLYRSTILSRAWQAVTNPIAAWLLFTLTLWGWHTPVLFEAALRDDQLHAMEHLCLLLAAMLFWWVLIKHARPNHVHYGMAVPFLFTTCLQMNLLSALMTFSAQPWYPYYADLVARRGMTPLADQQLAGLIMWVPGGLVFTLLTIGYFAAWLGALEKRSAHIQQPENLAEIYARTFRGGRTR